jgi:UDP-N-acetyl-D-mannosaminuronate dehydrogenase
MENKTIMVIGLGEIGKPLFNLIKKVYPEAIGKDIQPVEINNQIGIMHICIPFKNSDHFVGIVSEYAKKYSPEVIVVNSTVVPGTTKTIEKTTNITSIFSPIRGKHTRMESELLFYTKFIAGDNVNAVNRISEHFKSIGMKTEILTKATSLELAKLFETTYFGLLIAWAQEMDRIAKYNEGDYEEIVKFFQEISYLPPVVFQPGFIGGHCIMPNIKILKSQFPSDFLDAIELSNERKSKELKGKEDKLKERIEPLPNKK